MMEEMIRGFPAQLRFRPRVENRRTFRPTRSLIVAGMGGSALAAELLPRIDPAISVIVHRDYGVPNMPVAELRRRLFVISSYSGNTEEALDAFAAARRLGVPLLAIAAGGTLARRARAARIPFVALPKVRIQPRMALGYSLTALLAAAGARTTLTAVHAFAATFRSERYETRGRRLGRLLRGAVPLVYASRRNAALAYIWKIKFNETAKMPAFVNVFPELNHNEMTGFDGGERLARLNRKFHALLLNDPDDHPRIRQRMAVLRVLYRSRGIPVTAAPLPGRDALARAFHAIIIGDWVAYSLAEYYGSEAEEVPMVEEFKRRLR